MQTKSLNECSCQKNSLRKKKEDCYNLPFFTSKVYTFGSAVLDQTAEHSTDPVQNLTERSKQYIDTITMSVGGGAINSAKILQKLNVPAVPVCTIGNDAVGLQILNLLQKENFCTCFINIKPINSRQSWIIPTRQDTHIISYATTEHELSSEDVQKEFPKASLFFIAPLHTSDPATLQALIAKAQKLHIPVVCIASIQQLKNPACIELYKQATLLICNRKEALSFTPTINTFGTYFNKTVPFVCVTADKDGAYLFTPSEQAHLPAIPITVKNSTGAGDVFAATLTYKLLVEKTDVKEALKEALQESAEHISK